MLAALMAQTVPPWGSEQQAQVTPCPPSQTHLPEPLFRSSRPPTKQLALPRIGFDVEPIGKATCNVLSLLFVM